MRLLQQMLCVALLVCTLTGNALAGSQEREISLDTVESGGLTLQGLNPLAMPGKSHDDKANQTIVSGYAVASYKYSNNGVAHGHGNEMHFGQDDANTTRFGFDVMAIGFTKRYSDYAWVSAAIEVGLHDNATSTNTELDVGEIHLVAPFGNGVDFTLGKFNSSIGFEHEDAPLLLQVSQSLAYQFGTPAKMTGVRATYPLSENLEVSGAVHNGWNTNTAESDNNKSPSLMFQVGYAPTQWLDTKLSYLWGPEQNTNEDDNRNVIDFVSTLTPWRDWIIGVEASYGYEENQSLVSPGTTAEWYTGQVTIHHDFTRHIGTTLRYSFFDDRDGHPNIHTRSKRTMNEVTLAQIFHISPEYLGYLGFGTIPRTSHLISGLDLRFEYRYDWINQPGGSDFFRDNELVGKSTRSMLFAEVVANF